MKSIQKNNEPKEFVRWKKQEELIIQELLSSNNPGDAVWNHLPSSKLPDEKKEQAKEYYSKAELREVFIHEQGFICCYCNSEISIDSEIEHLHPKSNHPDKTLHYLNLVLSCKGAQKEPQPRDIHCNNRRQNKEIKIFPTHKICEELFEYYLSGRVKGNNEIANEMIEILGLNVEKLKKQRKEAIEAFIYNENGDIEDLDQLRKIIKELDEKNKEGKLSPFCFAIQNYIRREQLGLAA